MTSPKLRKHKELKPEELRWKCNPNIFSFESTGDISPIEGIMGQERALKAIRMGVDLRSPGYNIYIAGLSGSGKATTVKQMLEKISADCPRLYDYAYVNNFRDPDQPLLIKFQKGQAREFKQDLNAAIEVLKQRIPIALESELYLSRKKNIVDEYNQKEQELMDSFDKELRKKGFSLGQIRVGEQIRPDIIPLIEGQPVPVFQLEELIKQNKLTKENAQKIILDYNGHQPKLQIIFKKGLKISQEFQEKLQQLEKESAEVIVRGIFEGLKEKYNSNSALEHLNLVEENILDSVQIFKGIKPEGEMTQEGMMIDYFREYDLNIILDNSETNECPVIVETNPTYTNLFGTIEKVNDGKGNWYSDFTNIKSGSMLRANGGYLVLNVMHLFEEPGVWKSLKRVLTYNKLEIQESPYHISMSSTSLKPEPIDINTKVILIGSQMIYAYLSEREYDFKKMFKVKADFDYEIIRNAKVVVEYAQVVKKLIKEEKLKEFDKTAIAHLLEISATLAGRQNKLTLRFSQIADIAREASFWAADDGFNIVSAAHIEKAYQLARERHGMLEDKVTEMFENKTFLIDTEGERVGQINALAVYNADFYSFGRPTRITATVSLGSGTIINVEREAGMSGRHYNKGVLIISGYFRETFGQDQPLSFNANLVFEQSYGMVDGDSASCTEIFALLSTLSGLPIKQSIAVTGSLNQKGDVQPIGGVNEKIEGFFDICKLNGLTGNQGVIIPIQNVQDLMLREDIIEVVKKNKFHIYPITRVEEGIEILTGTKAGIKTAKGYEEGTVFYLVEKKIRELFEKSRAIRSRNGEEVKNKKLNDRTTNSKIILLKSLEEKLKMILNTEAIAKTKILATLGPATKDVDAIKQLILSGVDGVRLNLSHGTYDFFEEIFNSIHTACLEENSPLAVLVDLQGPKIRIGELEKSSINLITGSLIEITIEDIKGNEKIISSSYKQLVDDAKIGDPILINDGLIRLKVILKKSKSLVCEIVNGGILTPKKGMNLPGMNLSTPSITEKDFKDLEFVLKHRVDFIALSFVRSANDVVELKKWLTEKGKNIPVIAKIEKKEAVDNLREIILAADGIMIARGDLGVELPPQDVPVLQKSIIRQCNALGKLVITATQMLESMINSPIPTRAEASDVANAVWDGTDVVMLSAETSVGKFPFRTVQMMNDIIKNAELHNEDRSNNYFITPDNLQENLFDSVGKAIVEISKQINAQAIVVFTFEGRTARIISKYKPNSRIIAISNSFGTMNNLCLRRGVTSLYRETIDKEHLAIDDAKELILNYGLAKSGDLIIFTAGAPYSEKSRANWLRFEVI